MIRPIGITVNPSGDTHGEDDDEGGGRTSGRQAPDIDEVAIPMPRPGEVLVKIKASGVCHTDLHAADGDWPVKPVPPFTPGHEGAGIVAAIEEGVKNIKEGDALGIPDSVDFVAMAPILCAGVTTYKGIKETEAKPGEWIVISGIGGLGHIAIQYARAMGLHVIAMDVTEEKLALARQLGAELALNASMPDAAARVLQTTGGVPMAYW